MMRNLKVIGNTCFLILITIFGSFSFSTVATSAPGPLQFSIPDGDNITCVPVTEQPSFRDLNATAVHYQRRPKTRLHAEWPTYYDQVRVKRTTQLLNSESLRTNGNAFTCPSDTIPVRENRGLWFKDDESRACRSEKARAERDSRFLYQNHGSTRSTTSISPNAIPADYNFTRDPTMIPHEYAIVWLNKSSAASRFKGVGGAFNIWAPDVSGLGEFSLGQLWLTAGSYETHDLNTIEVGFQVSQGAYGDMNPRLFMFWTADAYNQTGCYNLECPGFVQVSSRVLVGGSFAPISRINRTQFEVMLRVFKDDESGNWWLTLNEENVGYWPKSLFSTLRDEAESMCWGGEIVDDQPNSHYHHTDTDMGSGQFAEAGFGKAAFVRFLQYVDVYNTLRDAPIVPTESDPACYTVKVGTRFRDWGSYFFYGGGGYSKACKSDSTLPLRSSHPP